MLQGLAKKWTTYAKASGKYTLGGKAIIYL